MAARATTTDLHAARAVACGEAEVDWLVFDEALRVSKNESARPPRSEGVSGPSTPAPTPGEEGLEDIDVCSRSRRIALAASEACRYHIDLADACPHNLANPRTMDEYQACTRRQRNPFFTLARTLAHKQGKSRMSET